MSDRFTIPNVRLAFPSVYKKAKFDGEETKFEATVLIPKSDEKTIKGIKSHIKKALLAEFGSSDKVPKSILRADKSCLRDGDGVDYDGFANHMSFKASNDKRPRTLDRDKTPVAQEDGKLYAGCYCDAIVEIWIQNNGYGTRINANLMALRHRRDGEAFGAGSIPDGVEDDFEDLEDEVIENEEMEEF